MLTSIATSTGLAPPSDTTITSLYLTTVPSEQNTDAALRSFIARLLSSGPEGVKSIVPVSANNCAFVNFKTREVAEDAAQKLAMRNIAPESSIRNGKGVKVSFGEQEVGVQWGRPRKAKAELKKADTVEQATTEKEKAVESTNE